MLAALMLLQAAAAAPVSAPSPEAIALGRQLAGTGTLAGLLPVIAAKETDELVAAHPELSAADQAELRRTAAATLASGRERILDAEGRAFAERLSIADLRTLTAAAATPAAARMRAALPQVIVAVMTTMASGGNALDFKGDTLKAFCAKTGKACPR